MRPIVTDGVMWCVCPSAKTVSPTKTVEPIKVPFGLWMRVGPKEPCIRWGPDPSCEWPILRWKGAADRKV